MKTMYRAVRTGNFVTIPNAMLRDKNLSFKARGMLGLILTNNDEWEVHKKWLEEQGPDGREAVTSGFRELEQWGYAVYSEEREKGKIKSVSWSFYDTPVSDEKRTNRTKWRKDHSGYSQEKCGKPVSRETCDTANPCNGEPAPKKTICNNDHLSEDHEKKVVTETPKREETKKPKPSPSKEILPPSMEEFTTEWNRNGERFVEVKFFSKREKDGFDGLCQLGWWNENWRGILRALAEDPYFHGKTVGIGYILIESNARMMLEKAREKGYASRPKAPKKKLNVPKDINQWGEYAGAFPTGEWTPPDLSWMDEKAKKWEMAKKDALMSGRVR